MRLLILGYSEIAKKRIIPAIQNIADFSYLSIASYSSAGRISLPVKIETEVFADYDQALAKSSADIVYISTVNSLHARWAKKALLSGRHVIVDKPAFSDPSETEKLTVLAKKSNLCLAEATVYAFHPQIEMIKQAFSKQNAGPLRLMATFSFPALHPGNFRYKKSLGGGALYDLGPYAVSCGRLFFGEEPKEIHCTVNNRAGKDNIEVSFSMLAFYPEGKSMIGHFGFDSGYCNFITLLGKDGYAEIERIFTIPAEMENEIRISENGQKRSLKVPRADCFGLFLSKVLAEIRKNNFEQFYSNLLSDARVLGRLRKASLA